MTRMTIALAVSCAAFVIAALWLAPRERPAPEVAGAREVAVVEDSHGPALDVASPAFEKLAAEIGLLPARETLVETPPVAEPSVIAEVAAPRTADLEEIEIPASRLAEFVESAEPSQLASVASSDRAETADPAEPVEQGAGVSPPAPTVFAKQDRPVSAELIRRMLAVYRRVELGE